jgi:uncharacterized membrane protein
MNVIDHAILIPASPAFIWRFLGDLSQNTQWQDDCTNLSFLTTQREGRGTRWRYTTPKGKDVVIEITAWYDTLGYEYMVVDGSSVGENKGRVRLQEIAEGTLVQWTFNYELDGMLSSLRNSMGLKRSLTNNIQDSLRNLYKYIQNETGGISTHEAKALLKEAPDVEERSSYQPRHPSNFKEGAEAGDETFAEADYPSEKPIAYDYLTEPLYEPPVAEDDTKPNPIVQGTEEIPVTDDKPESGFQQEFPEPAVADDDTKPNAPIIEAEVASPPTPEIPVADTPQEPIVEEPKSSEEPQTQESAPDIRDTSRISVFELFGLQKPSETQEMAAISDADLEEADIKPVVPTPPAADIIAKEEEDTSPPTEETVPDRIKEPLPVVPDTGATIEVEATEDDVDIPEQITIIEAAELNILQPDVDPSINRLVGLRATLRHKLIKLRTKR